MSLRVNGDTNDKEAAWPGTWSAFGQTVNKQKLCFLWSVIMSCIVWAVLSSALEARQDIARWAVICSEGMWGDEASVCCSFLWFSTFKSIKIKVEGVILHVFISLAHMYTYDIVLYKRTIFLFIWHNWTLSNEHCPDVYKRQKKWWLPDLEFFQMLFLIKSNQNK